MFCANCGSNVEDNVVFCPNCGKSAKGGENNFEGKMEQFTENPFFNFSKPYLNIINKGTMFSIYYILSAIINLLIPFVIIYSTINSGVFRFAEAKYIFAIVFMWLIIIFACWIGFQIWWNRRVNVINAPSEFFAIICFSDIIQTSGEWLGTMIAIIGTGGGLIALIFLGNEAGYLFNSIGLGFMQYGAGALTIIISPVVGFCIIIIYRIIAEMVRLFASLVNNTKEIADNMKNK